MDGHSLADERVDIASICSDRAQAYAEAKTDYDTTYRSMNMSNPIVQREWSFVKGVEAKYKLDESFKAWKLCSDCTTAAKKFFDCKKERDSYQTALINYREEYLKQDFTTPAGQRNWLQIEPALKEIMVYTAQDLGACENKY